MIAIEEADKFADEIIPNFGEINTKFGGLTRAPNKLEQFLSTEIQPVNRQKYKDKLEQMTKTVGLENLVCKLANKIESIATAFMKGIAAEEIIFESVAPVYCEMIEGLYFFYCYHRRHGNNINTYQNTISLYCIWSARIQKPELETHKIALDAQIQKVTDKSSPVPTLGTF